MATGRNSCRCNRQLTKQYIVDSFQLLVRRQIKHHPEITINVVTRRRLSHRWKFATARCSSCACPASRFLPVHAFQSTLLNALLCNSGLPKRSNGSGDMVEAGRCPVAACLHHDNEFRPRSACASLHSAPQLRRANADVLTFGHWCMQRSHYRLHSSTGAVALVRSCFRGSLLRSGAC